MAINKTVSKVKKLSIINVAFFSLKFAGIVLLE